MRASTIYLCFTSAGLVAAAALLLIHPAVVRPAARQRMALERQMVAGLGLTDLCLFGEAGYTRHPTLADGFAPFQTHPAALSHFPSESWLATPNHLHRESIPPDEERQP